MAADEYPKYMYHPEQTKPEDAKPSQLLKVRNERAEEHWKQTGFKPMPKAKAAELTKEQ